MGEEDECFGTEIKRCAKIIAVIGLILSVLSFNVIGFIVYVLVYLGVDNNKPGYLLPAKIVLIIELIFTFLIIIVGGIALIAGVIVTSDKFLQSSTINPEYQPYLNDLKYKIKIESSQLMIYVIVAGISVVYTIISYIVVNKARKFMLNENLQLSNINPPEYRHGGYP